MASSGRASSCPTRTSAMPGVSSIRPIACCWMRRASVMSCPRISRDRRGALAAAQDEIELEVAAAGLGADDGAGHTRQPAPQVLRNVVARAHPQVARNELDLDLPAVGFTRAAETAATTTAAVGHDRRGFRHRLLHDV